MSKMEQGFFYSEKVEMGKKKLKKKNSWTGLFLPETGQNVAKRFKSNKYEALHVILF